MPDTDSPAPLTPRCVRHRDALALAVCSRCGDHLCEACRAPQTTLCFACLARDPLLAVAPIPWEVPGPPFFSRLGHTLLTLFRPWARAEAFAVGGVNPAASFWLCTALPAAALAYVIPFTHTMLFEPIFAVKIQGNPSTSDIALDVLQAMGAGIIAAAIPSALHALALSLSSALRDTRIWLRFVLYWSWVYPVAAGALSLISWGTPLSWLYLRFVTLLAPVMFAWAAQLFVSRRARHTGWGRALFAALCGSVGRNTGEWLAGLLLAPILPPTPEP
jgi:hypothetical protein